MKNLLIVTAMVFISAGLHAAAHQVEKSENEYLERYQQNTNDSRGIATTLDKAKNAYSIEIYRIHREEAEIDGKAIEYAGYEYLPVYDFAQNRIAQQFNEFKRLYVLQQIQKAQSNRRKSI